MTKESTNMKATKCYMEWYNEDGEKEVSYFDSVRGAEREFRRHSERYNDCILSEAKGFGAYIKRLSM